jgi:uncharacterized protein YceK
VLLISLLVMLMLTGCGEVVAEDDGEGVIGDGQGRNEHGGALGGDTPEVASLLL